MRKHNSAAVAEAEQRRREHLRKITNAVAPRKFETDDTERSAGAGRNGIISVRPNGNIGGER